MTFTDHTPLREMALFKKVLIYVDVFTIPFIISIVFMDCMRLRYNIDKRKSIVCAIYF